MKKTYIFLRDTNSAPYSIDETATSGRFKDLEIEIDISQLRNYIIVRGGYRVSTTQYNQPFIAYAGQKDFILGKNPYSPVNITINDIAKTLGTDNLVVSGYDFVVNFTEKLVKCLDHAPLSSGDAVVISYNYKTPILISRKNQESIDQMKEIEGGTGIHKYPINDTSIATLQVARERALAELNQFAFPHISGLFITDQMGYKAGQLLTLDLPTRQIDTQVIIQEVEMRSLGVGNYEYEVQFSTDKE